MKTNKATKKLSLSSIVILLLLVTGCSTQDNDPVIPGDAAVLTEDPAESMAHLKLVDREGPVLMSGVQNYHYFAFREGELLTDADQVISIATLEFLEGHKIQLFFIEILPDGSERPSLVTGIMTPSGEVEFSLPAPLPIGMYITEIIELHSGCEIYGGPGINKGTVIYKGYFDGERLLATAQFHLSCEEWILNIDPNDDDPPPPPKVEGPVQGKWTIDITVD